MTMSLFYPSGKTSSTETHSEAVKKLTLFSASFNRIMMESRIRILNSVGTLSLLQSSQYFITFAVTIVMHKSRNLIGTLGSSEFEPT